MCQGRKNSSILYCTVYSVRCTVYSACYRVYRVKYMYRVKFWFIHFKSLWICCNNGLENIVSIENKRTREWENKHGLNTKSHEKRDHSSERSSWISLARFVHDNSTVNLFNNSYIIRPNKHEISATLPCSSYPASYNLSIHLFYM